MKNEIRYSRREQICLWFLSLFNLILVNGAFLYGLFYRPAAMQAALSNPISAAFILEAFIMLGLLAYLFTRWGVSRLAWPWLVGLALLGGLAFAVPVVLLFPGRGRRADNEA
jgi:hypothetical protein